MTACLRFHASYLLSVERFPFVKLVSQVAGPQLSTPELLNLQPADGTLLQLLDRSGLLALLTRLNHHFDLFLRRLDGKLLQKLEPLNCLGRSLCPHDLQLLVFNVHGRFYLRCHLCFLFLCHLSDGLEVDVFVSDLLRVALWRLNIPVHYLVQTFGFIG
jgi:hypothetical protein